MLARDGENFDLEKYFAGVRAAVPPGVKPSSSFWRDLQTAVAVYSIQDERRAKKLPWQERRRFQRIEDLADALGAELRDLRQTFSMDHGDPLWPNRALQALWPVKYRAESSRIGHEMLSHGYGGRRKPHRELLYAAVLDLWVIHLNQPLQYSRNTGRKSKPGGPLVRFFQACIAPVLGKKALPAETIATIIDRGKKRRSRRGMRGYVPCVTVANGEMKTKNNF
jgi:hypothetical protein